MRRERYWRLGLASIGLAALIAAPVAAADPVAIVEDVQSKAAGVEFMDTLAEGQVIKLAAGETLVLGYLKSCTREEIAGGTVTVGKSESAVAGGKVTRRPTQCDSGKLKLGSEQSKESGVMVFRAPPRKTDATGDELPTAQFTLYGASPLVAVAGAGELIIERLDLPKKDLGKPAERLVIALETGALRRGSYFDMAKAGKALTPGGLYRASFAGNDVVFRVDPFAKPGQGPLVGRLLRFPA